nr:MAG TPA: hypothetical protein [Caudoviricetes sp.]DAV24072.1 MAG TPA: hypothetical protein [Caudoviricetes sp.]
MIIPNKTIYYLLITFYSLSIITCSHLLHLCK